MDTTMERDDVVDVLNDLIETSKDGEYGFKECAEHAKSPNIKSVLAARSASCASGAAELQRLVATYGGERQNPVLIGRNLWPDALKLRGDTGARALMDRFPVVEVDCEGTGRPDDVDTLADLARLQRELDQHEMEQ